MCFHSSVGLICLHAFFLVFNGIIGLFLFLFSLKKCERRGWFGEIVISLVVVQKFSSCLVLCCISAEIAPSQLGHYLLFEVQPRIAVSLQDSTSRLNSHNLTTSSSRDRVDLRRSVQGNNFGHVDSFSFVTTVDVDAHWVSMLLTWSLNAGDLLGALDILLSQVTLRYEFVPEIFFNCFFQAF